MRVKANKNFWLNNSKRGVMENVAKGSELDIDHVDKKEAETLYSLLRDGAVSCIDLKFIPLTAEYKAIYACTIGKEDGSRRTLSPGKTYDLKQAEAASLLMTGHIKPCDTGQWIPTNLLGVSISNEEPKKMFDDPLIQKESWLTRRS